MPDSEYISAILEARRLYTTGLMPQAMQVLYREYAAMLVRLESLGRSTALGSRLQGHEAERTQRLSRAIRRELTRLGSRLGKQMGAYQAKAAERAVKGHERGLERAIANTGIKVSASFDSVPRRAVELMMVRRGLGSAVNFKSLLRRNLKEAAEDMDRYVLDMVATGTSHRTATRKIAAILSRNDPEVLEALKRLGPRGGRLRSAILRGESVPASVLPRAKRLLSDARRIAVTEINTAHHEANIQAAVVSPVVDLVRWRLSGNHSVYDECDVFSEANLYGLGPGLYYPETCPARPHPYCRCPVEFVLREPGDWGKPKRRPTAPIRLTASQVQGLAGQDLTPRRLERIAGQVNGGVGRAYRVFQGGRRAA